MIPLSWRASAEPGRNKGVSQTSATKLASSLYYRGRFTQFGKRTTIGDARSAMSLHSFGWPPPSFIKIN